MLKGDLRNTCLLPHHFAGEIHRARYMPSNSNIVATKSPSTDVFLFDCSTFPEVPENEVFKPTLRLKGHTKEG